MQPIVITGAEPRGNQVWIAKGKWSGLGPGELLRQYRGEEKLSEWVVNSVPRPDDWVELWGDGPDDQLDLQAGDSLWVTVVEEPVGFGDVIAELTTMFGIPPCGSCEERKRWLNEHLPILYHRKRRLRGATVRSPVAARAKGQDPPASR
jgi:hypothetical protein